MKNLPSCGNNAVAIQQSGKLCPASGIIDICSGVFNSVVKHPPRSCPELEEIILITSVLLVVQCYKGDGYQPQSVYMVRLSPVVKSDAHITGELHR